MGYDGPKIQTLHYIAVTFSEHLTLAFESLDVICLEALGQIVHTKAYDQIPLIPNQVYINTVDKVFTIVGSKINESTYIIQKNGGGEEVHISYDCSNECIITAIEYLYHMYKNLC